MHLNAFGAGIQASKLDNFINYINTDLPQNAFESCYTVDYVLDARENNSDLLYALASHPEYFGNHIDEITFIIKNISLASVMAMGPNKDSMKISYNGVDYIRFKDLDFVEDIFNNRDLLLSVYGRANLNTFNGKTSIQIFISDYSFEEDSHKYDF